MKAKVLHDDNDKTFVLVFDKGDEVVAELTAFARRQQLSAAHFTAIGALSDVTLGYFDRATRQCTKIPVTEQVEVYRRSIVWPLCSHPEITCRRSCASVCSDADSFASILAASSPRTALRSRTRLTGSSRDGSSSLLRVRS